MLMPNSRDQAMMEQVGELLADTSLADILRANPKKLDPIGEAVARSGLSDRKEPEMRCGLSADLFEALSLVLERHRCYDLESKHPCDRIRVTLETIRAIRPE